MCPVRLVKLKPPHIVTFTQTSVMLADLHTGLKLYSHLKKAALSCFSQTLTAAVVYRVFVFLALRSLLKKHRNLRLVEKTQYISRMLKKALKHRNPAASFQHLSNLPKQKRLFELWIQNFSMAQYEFQIKARSTFSCHHSLLVCVVKGHSGVLTLDCVVLAHCVCSRRDISAYFLY